MLRHLQIGRCNVTQINWTAVPKPGSYRDLFEHYGNPYTDPDFEDKFIVATEHTIANSSIIHIRHHIALVQPIHQVFMNLQQENAVETWRSYDGCFVIRAKRGSSQRSLHSWGLAIDVNAAQNGLGTIGDQPPLLVKAFKDAGFVWGGDFRNRKDPMHFQWTLPHTI